MPHRVINLTNSPHDLVIVLPAMGAVEATFAPAYLEAMRGMGYFEVHDLGERVQAPPQIAEPGPLDGSVTALEAHIATVTDVDQVQALIDAETAGKSRKGALAALEARRDELLAA